MDIKNLPALIINKLKSQEQYNKAKENNKINPDELYLVPDDTDEKIQALERVLTELSSEVNDNNNNISNALSDLQKEITKAESNANTYTDNAIIPVNEALGNIYNKSEIDTKVHIFHAAVDSTSLQYIKGSADFTYEQVKNTENCVIEIQFADEKVYLIKQEHKNIEQPDQIAGRYVGFSNIMRVNSQIAELFMFIYDPENLPTDEENLERLTGWGDSQYCVASYQPIVMGNFLDVDIEANRANDINAPSTKAVGDYADKQCGVVMDYMQTTFATNIQALIADAYGPHVIYENVNGFEASNSNAGATWHLTDLDLTPYRRLKFYVKSSGTGNDNFTPSHVVEMDLKSKAMGYGDYYVAGHMSQNPNNDNRIHCVTFIVNAEKTAVQFSRATSLYGTAATTSAGDRVCYLIEGYKN